MKRIYLAGPDVFSHNANEIGKELKTACLQHGLEGVFPLDIEAKPQQDEELSLTIFKINIGLIHSCHGVLANMNPFRGPSMDVGTAWEVGYAAGLKLPIVGYTYDKRTLPERVSEYRDHKSQTFMDPIMVEDFGLKDNLMLDCSMLSVESNLFEAIKKLKNYFNE